MMDLIITSLYFFLPAYAANMAAATFAKFNLPLSQTINIKLFGSHKTYKGFYVGYLAALLTLILQKYFYTQDIVLDFYTLLNYAEINIFLYAFLFGIGALTGDLIKSFFKRRLNKKPGSSWPPFDQIDLVLGTTLFLLPFYKVPAEVFLTVLIVTPLLNLPTNFLAYKLKLKDVWW